MFKYLKILCLLFAIQSSVFAGWFQQVSGTTVNLNCVNSHHGNENMAWACGENGLILFTSNGGTNWVQQTSGTNVTLYAICFMEVSGAPIMAVGDNGTILRTTNNGTNWVQIPSPTNKTLRDISDYFFIAVGDSGVIIKSTNSGLNWALAQTPGTQQLNACAGLFSMVAVGDNGTVWKASNNGFNWFDAAPSGLTGNLYGLPLFNNTDIAMGDNGKIWRSTNFGVFWSSQPSGTTVRLNSVEFSVNNESQIYACGFNGTILKSTNYGNPWGSQVSGTSFNLNRIFFYLDDQNGYCVGDHGTILKTTDGGGPIFTSIEPISENIPAKYSLSQNYPNPFNPSTKISFNIPFVGTVPRTVRLNVYDILGREVATLVNEQLTPGSYEIEWDAMNNSSGIYYYKLEADGFSETKKMILMK